MAKAQRGATKAAKKTTMKTAKRSQTAATKTRILVVEARYYNHIADALLDGAMRTLRAADVEVDVITVPGALEIPAAITIAVDVAVRQRNPYLGAVALGCVIQGETFHFDVVAMQSARAIMDISVAHRLPVGNGILTVDTEAQALARSGPGDDNKGAEAARAMLSLVKLKKTLA